MPLNMTGPALLLLAAAWLVAMAVVRLAIAYAHRRGMLDQPGQRRSHRVPTPRGGGIGVVLAVALSQPLMALVLAGGVDGTVWMLALATLLVAAVGWWDDHHSLPVLPRLGVQLLACGLYAAVLLRQQDGALAWWPLLVLAGTWSINLHNFMDGIDGLLMQQSVFVAMGMAAISAFSGYTGVAMLCLMLAAASLGFGYYNWPPARIFMGDVGSGAIGLQVFALGALLWAIDHALLWPVLMLSVTFVVDASLTLASRMLRGKRWSSPHREHLYQWLVRCGASHRRVDLVYLGWNVVVVTPCVWLALIRPVISSVCFLALYLVTAGMWLVIKRRCLRRDLHRARYGAT